MIFSLQLRSLIFTLFLYATSGIAQVTGTWAPLNNLAPSYNGGVMILLTDGSVMVKGYVGAADCDNSWYKLRPDAQGSYINGTWSAATPMIDSRLYFSSRVLRNGNVYVAGGEYGTGKSTTEIYNPDADTWDYVGSLNPGDSMSDANSEVLPDGKILQALVSSTTFGYNGTVIFDPKTNTYTYGPPSISYDVESSWLKLPDNSILFVDLLSSTTERYIPALNDWVPDGNIPVMLYDSYGYEVGGAILLPDGRGFFLGSTNSTAFYTPSGSTAQGSWTAGPNIPNNLGAPDAAAAMMANGKILCAFSPTPADFDVDSIFKSPTYFFEFDYLTNSFTPVLAPDGNPSLNMACYLTNMLDLPDGNVLYASQGDDQFYVYTPAGPPLVSGKPTINSTSLQNCDTLMITGTLFNGISEGACYGDDWQMATNYPLVRLTDGSNVYYAKTYNWNSDGVQRGSALDTTYCALPATMPPGSYSLSVIANGISSDPINYISCTVNLTEHNKYKNFIQVYPNPSSENTVITFNATDNKPYTLSLIDVFGKEIMTQKGISNNGSNTIPLNVSGIAKGIYQIKVSHSSSTSITKFVVN